MADRDNNLGGNGSSDESVSNPDLGKNRDSGMGGSSSTPDRDRSDIGTGSSGTSSDESETGTSGDDLSEKGDSSQSAS